MLMLIWKNISRRRAQSALTVTITMLTVLLFLVFTSLIGVCASEEMRCQTTKLWGIGAAVAVFGASLINLLSGKEGQVPG